MKLTKEEIKIWKDFQFFDEHGKFPEDTIKVTITLPVGLVKYHRENTINLSKKIRELLIVNSS